jgi:iron complex outermembrane receptor protein
LRYRAVGIVVLAAAAADVALAGPARAQMELPGVTVTAASPVHKHKAPANGSQGQGDTTTDQLPADTPLVTDDTFVPLTLVPEKEILATSGANLADSLQYKPGLAATTFAPGASRPVIRGLSGFRVGIQENGLSTGDVSALSDDHAVPVDPNAVSQIEVVRGPATLRYGSSAIGGIVNATNDRIPEIIPPAGFRVETRGGITSGNDGRDESAMAEAGAGNFAVHVDTFKRTSDDYSIPGGKQANTGVDSDGYSLGASYVFSKGYFGVAYTSFDSTYFIPGVEEAADKNHIVLNQSKWTSKGEWRVGDMGIDAVRYWFGATDYKHDEVDGLGAGAVIGSTFLSTLYEARVEAQFQPIKTAFGELQGAVGTQWSDRSLSSGGGADGTLLDPTNTHSLAGYVFEELQIAKKLRLQGAARIESDDVDGTGTLFPSTFLPPGPTTEFGAQRTFTPKSASAGILYDLTPAVVARLTATHAERAPDATELFFKGPHDSTGTFEIGNPNLAIEAGNTVELGFKKSKGDFRFDVSVYHTNYNNFIYKRFTGAKCGDDFSTCGTGTDFDQIVYSQQNATFYGAELEAEYDVGHVWKGVWGVQAQYDFVHATFDDGSFVPKMPPHRLGGGLYYRDESWLARISLLHAFAQNEFASFDTPTDGYNLLNAELSYTFKMSKQANVAPEVTIGIKGENLLNDDIRNSVSYKKDEVLEAGANVRLFGTVKLN